LAGRGPSCRSPKGERADPPARHRVQHEPLDEYTDTEDWHPLMQATLSEIEMSRRDLYTFWTYSFEPAFSI
jgi:hypothetical protein